MTWAFWWTAMTKATSSKSSHVPSRTAPPCLSKSFNATAPRDSAKATSEPCLNRLKWSRNDEGIYKSHVIARSVATTPALAPGASEQSPLTKGENSLVSFFDPMGDCHVMALERHSSQ